MSLVLAMCCSVTASAFVSDVSSAKRIVIDVARASNVSMGSRSTSES
jgi:hypothetical protein